MSARGSGARRHLALVRATSGVLAVALVGGALAACTGSSSGAGSSRASNGTASPATGRPVAGSTSPAPSDAAATNPPVGLDAVADFGAGVTVTLDRIKQVDVQAQGPGEVSGPAPVLTLTVTNRSDALARLDAVSVNLTGANGDPGVVMAGPPAAPLAGSLDVGGRASGVYVFAIDPADLSAIRVEASYSTRAPTVVFAGQRPSGG